MADDLDTLVKAMLQTKIIQALKDAPGAIDALVEAALSKKVDENGRPSSYGGMPYLEYLTGNVIRDAARESVQKVIAEIQPELDAKIREKLTSDDVVDIMVRSFVGRATEVATSDWKVQVKFEAEPKRGY